MVIVNRGCYVFWLYLLRGFFLVIFIEGGNGDVFCLCLLRDGDVFWLYLLREGDVFWLYFLREGVFFGYIYLLGYIVEIGILCRKLDLKNRIKC